jgi:drug/metabolite transporter (DMT)-like permease
MSFWRSPHGRGILLILLSTVCFSLMDTVIKHAMTLAPAFMLLWFRYTFQAVVTVGLQWPKQGNALLATANPRFQLLRGSLMLVTTTCAFFSLKYLPVGEFTAMVMLSPLAATALAAWLLKTAVPTLSWWMLALGLVGVLLVVHPGSDIFTWALIFPAILIVANAGFQVLTSHLSGEENPHTTQFYSGLVGALGMAPAALFVWDSGILLAHWPWFVLIGSAGAFGHLMLIRAYMSAPAPVLMPYIYSQIAFSMLGGWLAFNHVPDLLAWVGMAVIALSGVGNALVSIRQHRGIEAPAPQLDVPQRPRPS